MRVSAIISSLLKSLLNWSCIFVNENEAKEVLAGVHYTEVHPRPNEYRWKD